MQEILQNPCNIPGASVVSTMSEETLKNVADSSRPTDLKSHIPSSVSIGSHVAMPSNCSLSSEDYHVLGPLTRTSDDETGSGRFPASKLSSERDSFNESSSATPTKDSDRGHDHSKFSRKISDSDIEESGAKKRVRVDYSTDRTVTVPSTLRLLAHPEDSAVLNPLHIFVRQQIEVFSATPQDMSQPAPGRKNPIRLHQVGLRCIHCRSLPPRDRVKRAICYPSSVGRVYHSVSDMKFDHFSNCRGLPSDLRSQFESLKEQCQRRGDNKKGSASTGSSSSTAQYYHDSALRMGMQDSRGGIFMAGHLIDSLTVSLMPQLPVELSRASTLTSSELGGVSHAWRASLASFPLSDPSKAFSTFTGLPLLLHSPMASYRQAAAAAQHGFAFLKPQHAQKSGAPAASRSVSSGQYLEQPGDAPAKVAASASATSAPAVGSVTNHTPGGRGSVLLSMDTDPQYLNSLHCFVRRNVELFIADDEDISAPSPGRKNRVNLGQVGIRCIHCAKLPVKERVKRSVCYPPSVSGIYHSVSNMKFDHFANCMGLSPEGRVEFDHLRTNFTRRGSSTSNGGRGMSNSTAQYYHDSALRLGLVDTPDGIRFANQLQAQDKNAHDGISALMIAATDPDVRAEYNRSRNASVTSPHAEPSVAT